MGATESAAPRSAVAIMAKAPRPGAVKTRLCPPLAPAAAADLYRCFLLDTAARVAALEGARAVIAYAPADARPFFEAACPRFLLLPQRGADLGRRLAWTFSRLAALGFEAVVALGADTPTLPLAFVRRALDLLERGDVDVVLGPSEDGGYYLVGMRGLRGEVLEGIPWSTARVFSETTARVRAAGLALAVLPHWYDVDTAADLARLEASLNDGDGLAVHTRRFLREARHAAPGRSR